MTENGGTVEMLTLDRNARLSAPEVRQQALETLENGGVLMLPIPGFELAVGERGLISDIHNILSQEPDIPNGRPTIIFEPASGRMKKYHYQQVHGKNVRAQVKPSARPQLEAMMARFGKWTESLIGELFPPYVDKLAVDRVTYRPNRRDSTQALHVDSSYGYPTQGRGMLRIFCNINPEKPRVWQVGEPFEPFAKRFLGSVSFRRPGWLPALLARLGIVSGSKTLYDQVMAELRDLGKRNKEYQLNAPRRIVEFPSGAAWVAITDLVPHGAMSGQHSLDQTFFLPASAMKNPARSSLRILERLTGRQLV